MQLSKAFDRHPRTPSLNNLLVKVRNNVTELAPYATQDSLEDTQVKILNNVGLLLRYEKVP